MRERGIIMTEQISSGGRLLTETAVRMLRARNAADLEAIAAIRRTAQALCGGADEAALPEDPAGRDAYLSLTETCWQLQNRVLCTRELLCYEAGTAQPEEAFDLCRALRIFINRAEELTDGCLRAGVCEVPHGLYAHVYPERLQFVLLHLLCTAAAEQPDGNTLDFSASNVQDDLRIELVLRRDPEAEVLPFRSQQADYDPDLPDAPQQIIERFCDCFGVKLLQHSSAGKFACILTMPAARAVNPLVKVSSDSADYHDDTMFQSVLSRFVPAEAMLEAIADYM